MESALLGQVYALDLLLQTLLTTPFDPCLALTSCAAKTPAISDNEWQVSGAESVETTGFLRDSILDQDVDSQEVRPTYYEGNLRFAPPLRMSMVPRWATCCRPTNR